MIFAPGVDLRELYHRTVSPNLTKQALIHFAFYFIVSLQPFDFDPQDKNRHKFMVQSMYAPPGEINQESLVNIEPTLV